MKILCVGSGYVGLVSGTCFADLGNNVTCLDIDQKKVDSLSKGIIPIYEPGLKELVERNVRLGRLKFTTNTEQAVKQAEVIFICVGTPPKTNGEADMSYVYKAAENIGKHIDSYKVIANKSTVPVGTAEKVKRIINAELKKRKKKIEFDVVSNPEFLREGAAVKDFQNPDRIVVGTTSERAKEMLTKLYRSISRTTKPIFFTNEKNAELIKYASNAMLATRISFMNELSHLCEEIGADIKEVGKGMGLDTRIGSRFLQAGCGYGGSCLDGDEIIIIKETDTIRPIKIKELLNLKLRNLEIGSADLNNNQICFEKIKTATKREYKGDMIKIVTRMNKTLNVTEDHPFLVYEDNSFKIKLARDLSLKDTIPSMLHLPSLSKYDTFIDLIKILDKKTFDFTKVRVRPKNLLFKKFELQLSQKFKSTRLRDIIRSNCMNLKEYLDKDVEGLVPREELLLFTVKGTPSYVPVIIKINSSFMRFLGYYISEGYIHYEKGLRGLRARIGICFNINEKEYLKDLLSIYDSLNINYKIKENKVNSTVSITTSSRLIAFLLDSYLKCGKDSYSADVPSLIFSVSKENKIDFLRTLFRGDGHVAFPKNTNSVVYDFGSISYSLIHKSILLFLSLGIVPSYKKSISAKSTDYAHFFRISTKKQIKQLPFFKDKITQKKIDSVLEKCTNIKSVGFTRLNQEICLVDIKSIDKQNQETYVYSVEVENTENFITSHGLIVHNCFPKDVKAIAQILEQYGFTSNLLRTVDYINERQKRSLVPKLKRFLPKLEGKTIAIWGLSFKPRTDDIRESPSLTVIDQLLKEYAKITAYDPEALENARNHFKTGVRFAKNAYDALEGAHALIILTEWDEFREPDFEKMKKVMKQAVIIDGRNLYDPVEMKKMGFKYKGVGR